MTMKLAISGENVIVVASTSDEEAHLRDLAARRCLVTIKSALPAATQSRLANRDRPTAYGER